MNRGFSIRQKVAALIAGALAITLLSYLYVGTSLLVADKVSYLYDYSLTRLDAAAKPIENQLQQAGIVAKLLARFASNESARGNAAVADDVFRSYAKPLGVEALLLLRPVDEHRFRVEAEFGDAADDAKLSLAQLGWSPRSFEQDAALVGTSLSGRIPLGIRAESAGGKPLAILCLLRLDGKSLGQKRDYLIRLLDLSGQAILSNESLDAGVAKAKLEDFEKGLIHGNFESGTQDTKIEGKDTIVGYRRLASSKLLLVGYIPTKLAFAAAEILVYRSVFLGVSVLLAGLGLTLLFARRLTARLRQMWLATQRVSQGDFTSRVKLDGGAPDEVTDLADSFNKMAAKISDLMADTAKKARLERELETGRVVQSWFFPDAPFESQILSISGGTVAASKCLGDWWSYAKVGDEVVVVIGDVVGHGVFSEALVTAAAYGSFSTLVNEYVDVGGRGFSLRALVQRMNASILAATGGETNMTFLATSINLKTGAASVLNASHALPYIYRKSLSDQGKTPEESLEPMPSAMLRALGQEQPSFASVETSTYQLMPGDIVFWYTDGLMTGEGPAGEKLDKGRIARCIRNALDKGAQSAEDVAEAALGEYKSNLGPLAENPADDATLVVAFVAPNRQFVERTGERQLRQAA